MGKGGNNMKKKIKDYFMAMKFMAVCCSIAAIMGLIEKHDNEKWGN